MTLLDMVEKEDVCNALKSLCENKTTISPLLNDYLRSVSLTGKTGLSWELVKPLVMLKFDKVLDEWIQVFPISNIPSHYNGPDKSFVELRTLLTDRLSRFENVPYTIQRICELLVDPKRHYSRPDTFLRALQRVILVVSALDPDGNSVYDMETLNRESVNFESPMSRLSADEDSFETDEHQPSDVDMSISVNRESICSTHPLWAGTIAPPAIGFNSPATAKCLKQQAEREVALLTSTSPGGLSPLNTSTEMEISDEDIEKPVATNVPPIDQMLRPIGQLEAFVQNLAPATAESVRNVSSALLSPLTCGSTLLTQISASPKANIINFGLPAAEISQNLIRPLEVAEFNHETAREESDWLKNRKRDSSAFTADDEVEMKGEKVVTSEEKEEATSPPSPPANAVEQEPKPSPRKIARIDPEEHEVTIEEVVQEEAPKTISTTEESEEKPPVEPENPSHEDESKIKTE